MKKSSLTLHVVVIGLILLVICGSQYPADNTASTWVDRPDMFLVK